MTGVEELAAVAMVIAMVIVAVVVVMVVVAIDMAVVMVAIVAALARQNFFSFLLCLLQSTGIHRGKSSWVSFLALYIL